MDFPKIAPMPRCGNFGQTYQKKMSGNRDTDSCNVVSGKKGPHKTKQRKRRCTMNKFLKTIAIAAIACATLCGTALAAPHGGRGRGPNPAPRHHVVRHRTPPRRPVARHHNHHKPPRIVRRCHHRHFHHDCRWCIPLPPPCPGIIITL